ncbi:anti-sigma-V factor rsiV [Clostridium sp. D33t1_170424_F3]|uniref:anti-sigma-V factor rsiV n=1 Tax=Clostridium sp. D33t1_170424_F3 TaxID=2787099 RepID=UPI0018AB7C23|nr:anti-sigma-V factor rsiV [Clostridium sp. D33t1_170424_F3]
MRNLEEARKQYESMEIPEQLDSVVNAAFDRAAARKRIAWYKPVLSAAAAVCILFVALLNVSPTFAHAMAEVPVLGSVARVLTFRAYTIESDTELITVNQPSIAGTGNTEMEKRVNNEIQTKIDAIVEQARKEAKERREQAIADGYDTNEMMPVILDIQYEVKSSSEKTLSFVIYKTETAASAYTEQLFYNLDLSTGKNLTLREVLGPDYKSIADKTIKETIDKRVAEDPEAWPYFMPSADVPVEGFQGISDQQKFYIDPDGNVVVSFEKYEVGPGSMGIQDFVVGKSLV